MESHSKQQTDLLVWVGRRMDFSPSTFHLSLFLYPKKFGLIRRKITPDAPRSAIPTTTFIIIFLPQAGSPVAIMIPPITIRTNDMIKITVTNILTKLHIKTGNASAQLTPVSSGLLYTLLEVNSIHFPINGTDVLSDIQQQTHALLHGSQT